MRTDPFLRAVLRRSATLGRDSQCSRQQSAVVTRAALTSVEAVLTTWQLCGWKLRARNTSAVNLLAKLHLAVLRSPHMAIKDLKGAFTDARRQALTGESIGRNTKGKLYPRSVSPTRDQLYQISCGSRALPLPSEEECEKAVTKWKESLLSLPPRKSRKRRRDEKILDEFIASKRSQRIARLFQRRYRDKPEKWVPEGGAAALGFSRKDGGRSEHFRRNGGGSGSKPVWMKRDTLTSLDYEKARRAMRLRQYAKTGETSNEVEPVAVKERGYKVRVVSKQDPIRVARAHNVRTVLFNVVTHNETTVLEEPPAVIPVKVSPGRRVISVDLSKATDTISHRALDRIAALLAVDPRLLHKDFTIDGSNVLVGAFMGMPVSWTILEWTHQFACYKIDPSRSFRTKGDDCIAYWTLDMFWRYLQLMAAFGYRWNESKTFLSDTHGTFCEALYELRGTNLVLRPTVSVRSLVVSGLANRIDVMSAASREAWRRGFNMKNFNRALEYRFPRELEMLRKALVPLYLPRFLGGAALVPSDPQRNLTKYECILYWAGLDKDLPSVRTVNQPIGTFAKRVLKVAGKLRYRSGVGGAVCPHIEPAISACLRRAAVFDAEKSVPKAKPFSSKYMINQLSRIRRTIGNHTNFRSEVKWAYAYTRTLLPTPTSIQSVLPHTCNGEWES